MGAQTYTCRAGTAGRTRTRHGRQLSGDLRALAERPRGLLGRGRGRPSVAATLELRARRPAAAVLSLVRGRRAQHLPERGRPPRRRRPWRAARDHPRQPGHEQRPDTHVQGAARPGRAVRGRPARPGRRLRRPGDHLYADGAGSADRNARVRPHRRRAFGGFRRLRRQRARDPDRRRQAQARGLGNLRHRGGPGDPL